MQDRTGQSKMKVVRLKENNISDVAEEAGQVISEGGIAIVPTDTVYGIVCDGLNSRAKEKIYSIKGRSFSKPLIAFTDSIEKARKFAEIEPETVALLERKWPGATTFIFNGKTNIAHMTSHDGSIAFRIPKNLFLLTLANKFEILASTSANISKHDTPFSIGGMPSTLKEAADIVIDGGNIAGSPSTIWNVAKTPPRLLRGTVLFVCEGNSCRSPMAEFMLKDLLKEHPQIKILSAGLGCYRRNGASPHTVAALKEIGIDMEGFSSKPLTEKMVRKSDLIFVMDQSQKIRIISYDRESEEKIHVLGIDDPLGNDINAYRDVRTLLQDKIRKTVIPRLYI